MVLIEDEAATARTLALRQPVDQRNQRFGNVSRISTTLLAPPFAALVDAGKIRYFNMSSRDTAPSRFESLAPP